MSISVCQPVTAGTNRLGPAREPEVTARVVSTNVGTNFLSLKNLKKYKWCSVFFSIIISFQVITKTHISDLGIHGLLQYTNDLKFGKFDEKRTCFVK